MRFHLFNSSSLNAMNALKHKKNENNEDNEKKTLCCWMLNSAIYDFISWDLLFCHDYFVIIFFCARSLHSISFRHSCIWKIYSFLACVGSHSEPLSSNFVNSNSFFFCFFLLTNLFFIHLYVCHIYCKLSKEAQSLIKKTQLK